MALHTRTYAKRLLAVARKENKEDLYYSDLSKVNTFLNKDDGIRLQIESRLLENTKKIEILQKAFNNELDESILRNFFLIFETSPYEYTLTAFLYDLIKEYFSQRGIIMGVVFSAREISSEQLKQLEKIFSLREGFEVRFENVINKELIGGIKVVIEDRVWDDSYKSKIERLRTKLNTSRELYDETNVADVVLNTVNKFDNLSISEQTANETGKVLSIADNIVHISGIKKAKSSEIIRVGDSYAMVMDLKEDEVAAMLLQENTSIGKGTTVTLTGRVVEVPVGDELLGRVVDALGNPIDGKGQINYEKTMPIEVEAPGIIDRESVNEPLETGIKIIDSMIPIGKGQRELIIGDRQTGKTAIAIDAILNQKGKNVKCIYVAIGQKNSSVAQIIEKLEQADAMKYTTVVVAGASDLPSQQYIAPYSGTTIGEYWMANGDDVLIIYDDLSKQAIAYRTISLLLRRPPGREAYPGDIFYLHSRLLERSGKLCKALGNGSMTALPIIETQAGDISAYIPTNVISITDGQIFLQSDLFNSGIRPAIDYGLSVSRVGGSAQFKAIRSVASSLKLDLSQYQEVLSFAQFGSDLDASTRETISHGQHLVELLKQKQYNPFSMEEMVVLLYANKRGYIDHIQIPRIKEYEAQLLKRMHVVHQDLLDRISTTKQLDNETADELNVILHDFTDSFRIG